MATAEAIMHFKAAVTAKDVALHATMFSIFAAKTGALSGGIDIPDEDPCAIVFTHPDEDLLAGFLEWVYRRGWEGE